MFCHPFPAELAVDVVPVRLGAAAALAGVAGVERRLQGGFV